MPAEIAFTARLVPADEVTEVATSPKPNALPQPPPDMAADHRLKVVTPAFPPEPSFAHRAQKPGSHDYSLGEQPAAASALQATPSVHPAFEPAIPAQAAPADRIPESARTPAQPPARIQAAAPLPETAAPAPPRNVELKFSLDDGRVQVHVAERSGDVHVAVHTPDPNLAGTLRQDLPQLASRLEQTGFRAETWHGPDGAPADSRQGYPGGHPGQQHPQQQQHDQPTEPPASVKAGQEFSWLLEAFRATD